MTRRAISSDQIFYIYINDINILPKHTNAQRARTFQVARKRRWQRRRRGVRAGWLRRAAEVSRPSVGPARFAAPDHDTGRLGDRTQVAERGVVFREMLPVLEGDRACWCWKRKGFIDKPLRPPFRAQRYISQSFDCFTFL